MKRTLLVVIALLLLVGLTFGQDTTPKTKSGNFALLFGLGGLSQLSAGAYNGGVGAKYYIQDDLALRGMVSFTTQSIPNSTNNPQSYGIGAAVLYNWTTQGAVVGYIGGQFNYTSDRVLNATESSTEFGLAAVGGFEWFPYQQLSLSGEYQLGFTSSKPAGSPDSYTTFGTSAANSAWLTLSVYVK